MSEYPLSTSLQRHTRRPWLQHCLVAVVCGVVAIAASNGFAARTVQRDVLSAGAVEVLVFETPGCVYCRIFRRDVLPRYQRSARARTAPMRFIDVSRTDASGLKLSAPLTMLPTIVIMREGRERARISGYVGPEPFFHMVSQIMRSLPGH